MLLRSLVVAVALVCPHLPALARTAAVTVDGAGTQIAADLYGVNGAWHMVPAADFPRFATTLRDETRYTLMRYPGGWVAEHYDWNTNATPDWRKEPGAVGVDPETFLRMVPKASFVLPSAEAIAGKQSLESLVALYTALVDRYGDRVPIWEIGNEWWLQGGAAKNPRRRDANLRRYAEVVAAVAPAMKAANPRIQVYATIDWGEPWQAEALRAAVGEAAWRWIDGISLHLYCGDQVYLACASIAGQTEEIRTRAGKRRVYASEWAPGRQKTGGKIGLQQANLVVVAFKQMAEAGVDAAAYWPPVKVPGTSLLSSDMRAATATGALFGEMAARYRGLALKTSGAQPVAAALAADGSLNLIVPSMTDEPLTVSIALPPGSWSRIDEATVLATDAPETKRAYTLPAEVALDGGVLTIALNPPGSAGWQIGLVRLR